MTKRRVLARFMGDHMSLGYRKGAKYSLIVKKYGWLERFFKGYPPVHIKRTNGRQPCPYRSWEKFEENWKIIRDF